MNKRLPVDEQVFATAVLPTMVRESIKTVCCTDSWQKFHELFMEGFPSLSAIAVTCHEGSGLRARMPHLENFLVAALPAPRALSRSLYWLEILQRGLGHRPYCMEVSVGGETRGILPLVLVSSWLFGRFLVSLPYLNTAGLVVSDPRAVTPLLDEAVRLADVLDVRYLELRHEQAYEHPAFTRQVTTKVHSRLALPDTDAQLWQQIKSKVRNQVRKGQDENLTMHWGGIELLNDFYRVFAINMRDLGTPVYSQGFFRQMLTQFPTKIEFGVVRDRQRALAAALLFHGDGISEIPSASSLREFSWTNANMRLYYEVMVRSLGKGQRLFDFGRSTRDSGVHRFKQQWGPVDVPAVWQYYLRRGDLGAARPEGGRYGKLIALWQRLPVWATRIVGPQVVKGIP